VSRVGLTLHTHTTPRIAFNFLRRGEIRTGRRTWWEERMETMSGLRCQRRGRKSNGYLELFSHSSFHGFLICFFSPPDNCLAHNTNPTDVSSCWGETMGHDTGINYLSLILISSLIFLSPPTIRGQGFEKCFSRAPPAQHPPLLPSS
jgi:hypothetical protein